MSEFYQKATGEEIELPHRYKHIFNEQSIRHIRSLLTAKYEDEGGGGKKPSKNEHSNATVTGQKKDHGIQKEKVSK